MNKVLVLEDYQELNNKICSQLKSIPEVGQVESCTSIKMAMEKLNKYKYTLFIVDLELPDGLGRDFIKLVRSKHEYRTVLIAIITGKVESMEEITGAFNSSLCQRYFQKPLEMGKFKQDIIALLNTRIVIAESQRLTIKRKHSNFFFEIKDIMYIETNNKMTTIYTVRRGVEIGRYSLSSLTNKLPENFIRCHRSFIVNREFIDTMVKTSTYYYIHMSDKTRIPIGISYKDVINSFI